MGTDSFMYFNPAFSCYCIHDLDFHYIPLLLFHLLTILDYFYYELHFKAAYQIWIQLE